MIRQNYIKVYEIAVHPLISDVLHYHANSVLKCLLEIHNNVTCIWLNRITILKNCLYKVQKCISNLLRYTYDLLLNTYDYILITK